MDKVHPLTEAVARILAAQSPNATYGELANAAIREVLTFEPTEKMILDGTDPNEALIREIAMDIGKELVAYIEVMYPAAIAACPSTFKLSVRNCVHNEIMAAIKVNDEGKIVARLKERKLFRRQWVGMYRKMRAEDSRAPKE